MRQYACIMQSIVAANDEFILRNRNRALPILNTVTSIQNYPTKLTIFLTNASRFWQVRCYFFGKVVIRTLRTTNKRDAIRLAKKFYDAQLLHSTTHVIYDLQSRQSHSIEFVTAIMLQAEQARVDRGEVAMHSLTMLKSRLTKHVLPFFGSLAIEDIGYGQIDRFFNFLCTQNYKPITLSQYLMALRKVLNTAHANRWIEQVPQFPKLRITSTARGNFTVTEYLKLLRHAKTLRNIPSPILIINHRYTRNGVFAKDAQFPFELSWLIRFMVNSFVRPVDIKLIQHKHVEVIRGEHCYLRLSLPETKRHTTQIVTLPAAVHVYEMLFKYFDRQGLATAEDYLFLPAIHDRQTAIYLLEGYFRRVLMDTNLRYGTQGQRRSLYSLRHSAITFRLLYGQGIDLLTLARNARTSLEMVDKFYASELRAEMNIGMLHSRR